MDDGGGEGKLEEPQWPPTQANMARLAAYQVIFADPSFSLGAWAPMKKKRGDSVFPHFDFNEVAHRFQDDVYKGGWVRCNNWPDWLASEGKAFFKSPASIAEASVDQIANILTVCMRRERFVDGAMQSALEAGVLLQVVRRIGALAATQESVEAEPTAPSA